MNKRLVTIIVATIELEFDTYLPNNKKIGTIKEKLIEIIAEISENNFLKEKKKFYFQIMMKEI
ncbi:MAG: hypothetical protein ACK5HP_00350 [Bacilli bacterium]